MFLLIITFNFKTDPLNKSAPACVENIADAVTHARFVGTDTASDGDVLMKILQVGILKLVENFLCEQYHDTNAFYLCSIGLENTYAISSWISSDK